MDHHHLLEHISDDDTPNTGDRRSSRAFVLQQLPSNNLTVTKWDDLSLQSRRKSVISESYKIRRSSNLNRQVFTSRVSDVVKILETLLEEKNIESALEHLKEIRAKLSVKKEVKRRFLLSRRFYWEFEQRPFSMFQYHMKNVLSKAREQLFIIAGSLELWNKHIKSVHGIFGSGIASYFVFLRWLLFINILNFLTVLSFIVLPQWLHDFSYDFNKTAHSVSFDVSDLLTGSGYFNNTLLYYGHYTDEISKDFNYNTPLAYLLTITVLGFMNLAVVAKSLASSYKSSRKSDIDYKNAFCHKLFCGWDCGIENQAAANLKKQCIFRELLELLCQIHKGFVKKQLSEKVLEWAFGIFVNIFVLSLMFGFGYLVYFIQDEKAVEVDIPVFDKLSRPLTMTAIAIGFYFLLTHTSKFESYISKEKHLYLTLIRVCVMRNVIIAVLLYFRLSAYERLLQCSENIHGEEIYRFILVNFLVMTVLYDIALYIWKYLGIWSQKYNFKINPPQFDVAIHTNDLIYYQTLVWIGTFSIPMISMVFIFVIVVNFYGMVYTVKHCCKPDPKAWLPSFAHTVFIFMTFLCLLLATAKTGYVFVTVTPSSTCGPFRTKPTMYSALEEWYNSAINEYSTLRMLATLLKSPIFILGLFLFLCIAVHCAKSHATAMAEARKYFEHQVVSESKNKVFLLKLYEESLFPSQTKEKTLRMRLKSISMKN